MFTALVLQEAIYFILKGAIQGQEKFADDLALGVRSLLGHAVDQYE